MIFASLSEMAGDTLEGDDTEGRDSSVGIYREKVNFHNFKIISLAGVRGLYF